MKPIQVVGDRDTVLTFQLGGIPGQIAHTAADARAAITTAITAVRGGGGLGRAPALLLVTHGTAEGIRDFLDGVILDPAAPLILEIPGAGEPMGERPVEAFVERVLGMHL